MKLGAFMMPNNPPDRGIATGHYHNLDYISFIDKLGLSEVWIGEHYTVPREPCPSPDLMIAQAILETENIKLCPGAFILPYHHPVELAHRIAYLDHISNGRLIVGVGSSGVSTDLEMFNVDGAKGENRDMVAESVEIMTRLWESEEPFTYEGEHWTVSRPSPQINGHFDFWMKPLQKPHPPIAIAGLSPNSPTLVQAGKNGYIPLSLCLGNLYLQSHWDSVLKGAAMSDRTPDKNTWRVGRDIYVADTDEEARNKTVNGFMGDHYREYFLPLFKELGMLDAVKQSPDVPDSDVTVEYLAQHCWVIGSPSTVKEKLHEMVDSSGGFGTLLSITYDHLDDMEGWRDGMTALQNEIMPEFADL